MRTQPFRRTIAVAVLALIGTGLTVAIPTFADAQEEFVNGSGRGKSSIVRVGPSAAQLSLATSVGVSLADHITSLGRGEVFILDYAALDGSIPPEMKVEFPQLRVESRDAGSDAGVRWEPKPGLVETAQATTSPVGRSSMEIQGFSIPGVIEITGGKSRAFSGVYTRTVDGKKHVIRAAGGTVDIPKLSLGGGAVVLHDLRWEAAQITDRNDDTEPEIIGAFRVGRLVANGETQGEGLTEKELAQILDPMEPLFTGLGIFIEAPKVSSPGGAAQVSPLRVKVANSHLAPVTTGLQDARQAAADEFITQCQAQESGSSSSGGGGAPNLLGRPDPGGSTLAQSGGGGSSADRPEFNELNSDGPDGATQQPDFAAPPGSSSSDCGLPFLIADLAVAPVTGFGQLDFDLGGVLGVTEGAVFDSFNLFGEGEFELGESTFEVAADDDAGSDFGASVLGTTQSFDEPSGAPSDSPATPAAAPAQGVTEVAAPQVFKLTGSRASAAWAVGLVGLGAALAMAASDYRRLRMRRRAVTPIT